MEYKIFCDESLHLRSDSSNLMVNGALKIADDKVVEANKFIKYLRHQHNYHNELKWTKLISKQEAFYFALIDYFFDSGFMTFKATLVVDKDNAKHEKYNRTHDEFYYVVYYYTLRNLLSCDDTFKIYFDYKDTLGAKRVANLKQVIENSGLGSPMFNIIRSHESQLIQLCDLFIGAIGYANRQDIDKTSEIKNNIALYLNNKIEKQGYNEGSISGTKPWANKFNVFRWSLSNA